MSTISRFGYAIPKVSPLQLEVLDWTQYAKVFDVRSSQEYRKDHVPGAVNFPVPLNSKRRNTMLAGLEDLLQQHLPSTRAARLLVYGAGSDPRVQFLVDYLTEAGFEVDTLYGGWQSYRRWVTASLEVLPYHLTFRWLRGSVASGKEPLLDALKKTGKQTVDLTTFAEWPERILPPLNALQPTQMLFESRLLEALRLMDARRVVWIAAETQRLGRVQIPYILYSQLLEASTVVVKSDIEARIHLLFEQEPSLLVSPLLAIEQSASAHRHTSSVRLEKWKALAISGRLNELYEQLLNHHYDPLFERALENENHKNGTVTRLHLKSLNFRSLRRIARQLALQQPS